MSKVICAGYIFLLVGVAWGNVGKMPVVAIEPYQWWVPFFVFELLSVPAILGYSAGRKDAQAKKP